VFLIISGSNLNLFASIKQNDKSEVSNLDSKYLYKIPEVDYILGPGDLINVDFSSDYPELKTKTTINGEGIITLPYLGRVFISGLTPKELSGLLNKDYKKFIKYPSISVQIADYRPIRIFVEGEVGKPGFITLRGAFSIKDNKGINNVDSTYYFPTVFDAIQKSNGITRFSDLSNIQIIRKNNKSNGGGKITTYVNFEKLLINGDKSQNLRIYDSDIIRVSKSKESNEEILKKASLSRLNPLTIEVIITGSIQTDKGLKTLPRSTYLSDALQIAVPSVLRGKVTFMRFNLDGTLDRRIVSYKPLARRGSYINPKLKNGDVIIVGSSIFTKTSSIVKEFTSPFIGIFSAYAFFDAIND